MNKELWTLSDTGELSVIRERPLERRGESLPEQVMDLCTSDGRLLVLTRAKPAGDRWTLRRRVGRRWISDATIASEGDWFEAMFCTAEGTFVLTVKRLVEVSGKGQRDVPLVDRRPNRSEGGFVSQMLITDNAVFVSFSHGEFGGGLRRIDRRTGAFTVVEHRLEGGSMSCAGSLVAACHPVTGLVASPWKPGCLLAAVGRIHLFSHDGGLFEVCGDVIEERPLGLVPDPRYVEAWEAPHGPGLIEDAEPPPAPKVGPLFGLQRTNDGLVATGPRRLYHVRLDGTVESRKLPPMQNADGIWVSFGEPGIVLVMTSIHWRDSTIGGSVPMIVPR